jgi:hypothetical protein
MLEEKGRAAEAAAVVGAARVQSRAGEHGDPLAT